MQNTGPYPNCCKLAWLTMALQPRSGMTVVTVLYMAVNFKSRIYNDANEKHLKAHFVPLILELFL